MIAGLIMLSLILIASVVDPHLTARQIITIMATSAGLAAVTGAVLLGRGRLVRGRLSSDRRPGQPAAALAAAGAGLVRLPAAVSVPTMRTREHEAIAAQVSKENWRMPRLAMLAPAPMSACSPPRDAGHVGVPGDRDGGGRREGRADRHRPLRVQAGRRQHCGRRPLSAGSRR